VIDLIYDKVMLSSCYSLADDEEATGPGGRSYAQHKGHEDLWALRIQLLRRQFIQIFA